MNSGIYEIVCKPSGKRYIGSAISFDKRWNVHRSQLNRGVHHCRHMQRAWNKHGAEQFEFSVLLVCSGENLVMFEQRAFDVFRPEFNTAPRAGSSLGMKHRPESIEKLRAKQTGVPSPTKGMMRDRAAVEATASAHRGMKRSAETREKIAAKARGRVWTEEAKAKLSATTTGRTLSPEHRAKLIGNKHAVGLKHTDEWKARNSALHTGRPRPKSPEYRAKIAATLRGRKATPEARANQSAAQLGKKRGPYKSRQ